jgi:hypothetical protein
MPAIATTPSTTLVTRTVYTSNPFDTSTVPITCTTVVNAGKNASSANDLLDIYHIDPSKTGQVDSIQKNLEPLLATLSVIPDQGQTFTSPVGRDEVNTHLRDLENTYLPVIRLAKTCLQESLQIDQSALKDSQSRLEEAQSRLASITNPEENVSYYEGWFPIVRPMTESALLGLFGAAIFMLLMSVLVFLRLQGVEINLIIPDMVIPYFTLPPNASYYIYGGLATGIIGSIGYAYYVR